MSKHDQSILQHDESCNSKRVRSASGNDNGQPNVRNILSNEKDVGLEKVQHLQEKMKPEGSEDFERDSKLVRRVLCGCL